MAYESFDRLTWLINSESVTLKNYMSKWERDRHTFFRDIDHLKVFYGIEFRYNRELKCYDKVQN